MIPRLLRAPAAAIVAIPMVLGAAGCGDPLVVLGDSPGIMRVVAGVPDTAGTRPDTLARNLLLTSPRGVAIGSAGLLYVSDSRGRIVEVTSSGRATVIVDHSSGSCDPCIVRPESLVLDRQGGLVIADPQAQRVLRLDLVSRTLTVLAGTGTRGDSPDGTPAAEADLLSPHGVAIDQEGRIYFTEFSGNRIRWLDASNTLRTLEIDEESASQLPPPLEPEAGIFLNPAGLVIGGNTLYVADSNNNRILAIDLTTRVIRHLAGTGLPGFGGDGGPALAATLRQPNGLALSPDGRNLYVADGGNHRVRSIHLRSETITTLVGNGSQVFAGEQLAAGETSLARPSGLAVSPLNLLFIADTGHHVVWRTSIGF